MSKSVAANNGDYDTYQDKPHYYYDAEPWVKWCIRHNETHFSSKLDLYQLI